MKKVFLIFCVCLFSCFAGENFVEKPIYQEMPIMVFDVKKGRFTEEYPNAVISQYYEGKYKVDSSLSTRKKLEENYKSCNSTTILVKEIFVSIDNKFLFVVAYGKSKKEVARDYGAYIVVEKTFADNKKNKE